MKMKKKGYAYLAIVLVLIIGGYLWYKSAHSTTSQVQYRTEAATKGTLVSSVSASGNVIVDSSATVDPDITGTVANLAVSVGDQVKKGQALFTIVNDQLGISASQAQSAYISAQASLVNAQAAINSAEASYKNDKKISTTHDQKEADQQKIEAAKVSEQAAEQNVSNALASLTYAQQQAAKRSVTAPIDGTVNEVNVKNGDDLSRVSGSGSNAQAPIIIGDMGTLKAQVQVNEVDISNVKIGQKVTLTFDALPDFTATGTVESMDSLGTVSSGVVTYDVKIKFDQISDKIKPGMSTTAAIITGSETDVIMVPTSAIKTTNGQSYVQVMQSDGTPKEVNVQLGNSNDADTVITSGVNAGDKVVTQTIKAGSASSAAGSSGGNNAARGFRAFGG